MSTDGAPGRPAAGGPNGQPAGTGAVQQLTRPRRRDPDGFSHTMAGYRIEDLDEVWRYVENIDFSTLKRNMQIREDGLKWSAAKCDYLEQDYKRWLFLRRKHEDESLPPTGDIDKFWHEHMLDTRAYFADCAKVFGYYHHHFPYFGVRGDADRLDLEEAFRGTCRRYHEAFGVPLRTYPGQD